MNTVLQTFGFYGRAEELDLLIRAMTRMSVPTVALFGLRRIGKTELLDRAIAHIRALPACDSKPIVSMEIPEIDPNLDEQFRSCIHQAGLADRLEGIEHWNWSPEVAPQHRFSEMVSHLVKQGVVVCLDEFHNIENYPPLKSNIKRIIDILRSPTHNPQPTGGGIVVAGSHQQNMLRILKNNKEPLYDRFLTEHRLIQLKAPALLEMAAEQGWLRDPRQFLTLYSAYGGVPGLWSKYHEDSNLNPNLQYKPNDSGNSLAHWQARFWQYESLRPLHNVRDSYNFKGMVEQNSTTERILRLIATHPEGYRRSNVLNLNPPPKPSPEEAKLPWRTVLENSIEILEDHLQMIRLISNFKGKKTNVNKYRINDNDVRHQLLIKKRQLSVEEIGSMDPIDLMHELFTTEQEGHDLEKIAMEYLVHRAKYSIGEYNVQLPNNGPEIDVLVWPVGRRQSQIQPLIMGSCKRDADELVKQSYSPERVFGPFLQTHFDNQNLPRPKLIRYMVIAPHLSTEQHQTLERRGFEPLDLRKMADELGLDPRP